MQEIDAMKLAIGEQGRHLRAGADAAGRGASRAIHEHMGMHMNMSNGMKK